MTEKMVMIKAYFYISVRAKARYHTIAGRVRLKAGDMTVYLSSRLCGDSAVGTYKHQGHIVVYT